MSTLTAEDDLKVASKMSFSTYSRLFFSLLFIGLGTLIYSMFRLMVSSGVSREETKITYCLTFFAMGCAALVNTVCGIQHKKMWAKGGVDTQKRFGKAFYIVDIPVFLLLGLFMIFMAMKFLFITG